MRTLIIAIAAVVAAAGCGARQQAEPAEPSSPEAAVMAPGEEHVSEQDAPETEDAECEERVFQGGYNVTDEASLEGLEGYTMVTGHLRIVHTSLASVERLECLREVGSGLVITFNDALTNLDGLSGLTSVRSMAISQNDALTSLDGLSGLTSVGRNVSIYRNGTLASLRGLGGLTSVGGNLYIESNDALTNLDGLSGLTSVTGDLCVRDNSRLPTCAAEALKERLLAGRWAGEAHIEGNDDQGTCQ